jgi:medium-chain acyl-[acyl-carrier-protein] hydrolase
MTRSETYIYKQDYTIRSYEVDAAGNLSVPSIFNLLQDAASSHALELGVSVPQLLAESYTWVLSRMVLRMSHYPGWRDTIQIRTWPSGIQGAFALRDFDIRDQNGNAMGCSTSAWIVMNTKERRPVRPTVFADRLKPAEGEPIMDYVLKKLPRQNNASVEKCFNVRYSDLDINQHVNNVSYIEWILESIPRFGENSRHLAELEINFLGEVLQGDRVLAGCIPFHSEPKIFTHSVIRESDRHELIRARTSWE